MKTRAEEEMELRRYLLRDLPPEEVQRIEARLFLERKYRELLQSAGDELVDEYVNRELAPGERERFETHFLADPLYAEDLRIAEALQEYIASEVQPLPPPEELTDAGRDEPPTLKRLLASLLRGFNSKPMWAAAAVVLVALGLGWLAVTRLKSPRPGPTTSAPRAESHEGQQPTQQRGGGTEEAGGVPPREAGPGRGQQEASQANPPPGGNTNRGHVANERGAKQRRPRAVLTPPTTAAFFLSPLGVIRNVGEGAKREGPASSEPALLRLVLLGDDKHKSYRAALLTDSDELVHSWGPLKPAPSKVGKVITVPVPAGLLRPEQYQIKLTADLPGGATKTVGTYRFRAL